jgi:hypothetical protein
MTLPRSGRSSPGSSDMGVQFEAVEPIVVRALDGTLSPVIGSTTIVATVWRTSDGCYLDWDDMMFKSSGWTTLQGQLSEVDATNSPGVYQRDLDLTSVINLDAGETLQVEINDTAGTAKNMPQDGEIKVAVLVMS